MKLSNDQQKAYDLIMQWLKDKSSKRFVLAGYAGTGKTTLAKTIAETIGMRNVTFCAYTGKAANVLRENGCSNSTTIHSAIYLLVDEKNGSPRFALNVDGDIKDSDLVIVDEYSMLDKDIRADLELLCKKILYLGDPFQLPPVFGECDLEPNFFIKEIHRQALESPIIRYATDVRNGKRLSFCKHDEFLYQKRANVPSKIYFEADQIIVGYNKTRIAWNRRFRQHFKRVGDFPNAGEKLICTKNNHVKGLYNGMICTLEVGAEETHDDGIILLNLNRLRDIEVWAGDFWDKPEKPEFQYKQLDRFDYAYAITCHKSQGSEFDHVLIYNQPIGKTNTEKARWLYTAITRSKKKCTIIQP